MRTPLARAALLVHLTVGLSLLTVSPAAAYIDPSAGSLVFQAVVGGVVAVPVIVAAFWKRLSGTFRRRR